MSQHIKTWRDRLAGLDKPTDFAEAQAAKMEAADLRRYIAELERDSQGGGGEAVDAARYRWLREEVANAAIEGVSGAFVSIFTDDGIDVPEELDAAIDAARASLDGRRES